ncbi:uncharacterized protein CTRU02_214967 [Colletotrichum truncatum]|uniref:Uncharacterized protein n=1 Tax=Colletotrichum truncatum TaxID=5467 RepID=A0ACC3YEA0_COLTU|nr:uncharacterized protein CTRU02_08281 [Colletotrichum truncatum]KAF6790152.1 hypothetical protein CTRU02_08281 [Colletotrichum truncatum]
MSATPDNEPLRQDERSRCWATNVEEEESESQPSEGGFLAGITVTTEISISDVCFRPGTV